MGERAVHVGGHHKAVGLHDSHHAGEGWLVLAVKGGDQSPCVVEHVEVVVLVHTARVSSVLAHVTVGEVSVRGHEVTAVEIHGEVCPELEHVLLRRVAVLHRLSALG